MKRKIIHIDEDKCTGCGDCIPNCPEGAIQMIDGKARLISDLFCDGLGACIGTCPVGAIKIEEREAEPYNEEKTMENIIKAGPNTIKAHLEHLKDHGEEDYYKRALKVLTSKNIPVPETKKEIGNVPCGCMGSKMMDFSEEKDVCCHEEGERQSQLRQWPVQLHLVPTNAPYFQGKDVLLAADCVAYSLADFHKDYLKGKSLAIACPKLDSEQEIYIEKIKQLIDQAQINTLTVMIMEVPCCSGLLRIAELAAGQAKRKIPIKKVVVGISGKILKEEWI
ncbi:4Fe-4S ferredoxin [candidate division WOR-1 bacterium RIFOXYA12_FULL_43_27]|uniref:4Fe-4S ferredoxin n=1 Tax=candidate division WOR-1 bacterium RIFOXYC2_FULL_46_14 TaxID=1802587 RepID=A0A1F4U838_UNCSA|nr:MAG: 4Fe-4S ferredoxin [candidate division WOR-1 bacterium RIFOXYA12_FULL_43_27]OGC19472.1 MAG: 4Fe-4S ferredoxin [candidate division WOR-1 bacterium RIFOXYB2_FULL_46_45]OGC30460.1 MAG: 4Fe-4S ferredoxin [candidate division WOR-1 bacterium RIFOXYA2_FULL_46_56]OGC41059.1 MAG: 4Fe-4S ferredoxin [candidate division WOR-1 bacterium RIFOXYC2_FULL_46_14]